MFSIVFNPPATGWVCTSPEHPGLEGHGDTAEAAALDLLGQIEGGGGGGGAGGQQVATAAPTQPAGRGVPTRQARPNPAAAGGASATPGRR